MIRAIQDGTFFILYTGFWTVFILPFALNMLT